MRHICLGLFCAVDGAVSGCQNMRHGLTDCANGVKASPKCITAPMLTCPPSLSHTDSYTTHPHTQFSLLPQSHIYIHSHTFLLTLSLKTVKPFISHTNIVTHPRHNSQLTPPPPTHPLPPTPLLHTHLPCLVFCFQFSYKRRVCNAGYCVHTGWHRIESVLRESNERTMGGLERRTGKS